MAGAEEIYRSMQSRPSPYQRSGRELDLAERQLERDARVRTERRDANERAARERNDTIANTISEAPRRYMEGADWKQRQEEAGQRMRQDSQVHEQSMRQGEENIGLSKQQYRAGEQAYAKDKLSMEEAQRDKGLRDLEADYWRGEESPGAGPRLVGKAAAGYRDTMDEYARQPQRRNTEEAQALATLDATKRQTALMGAGEGRERQRDMRERMDAEIAEAVQSQDPKLLADTRERWGKAGFSQTEMRLAEAKGNRAAAANRAASEFASEAQAQGTQQGQAAMQQISALRADKQSLGEIVSGMRDYQKARLGSQEAAAASEQVVSQLRAMGKNAEADQIESFATADTTGVKSRLNNMQMVAKRLLADSKRRLASAAATAQGVKSTSIQNQLRELQAEINQLEQMANGRVNLIGGGLRPPGGNAGFTTNPVTPAAPPGGAPGGVNFTDFNRSFQQSQQPQQPGAPSMRQRAVQQPGQGQQLPPQR